MRGSDITDVTFGPGGSLYAYQRARDAGDGWYEADVPAALVHALASGDQFGLMLDDEKGQTQTRHVLSSREGPYPPVLIVEGTRADRTAPGKARALARPAASSPAPRPMRAPGPHHPAARQRHRAVRRRGRRRGPGRGRALRAALQREAHRRGQLRRGHPRAALVARPAGAASRIRWSPSIRSRDEVTAVVDGLRARARSTTSPRAPPTRPATRGRWPRWAATAPTRARIPALPAAAAVRRSAPRPSAAARRCGPFRNCSRSIPRTGALLESTEAANHRVRNAVWDAGTATVKLTGARNEFVAFQLAVEGAAPLRRRSEGGEAALRRVQAAAGLRRRPAPCSSTASGSCRTTAPARGWYPDPLIPLEGPLDVPVEGQRRAGPDRAAGLRGHLHPARRHAGHAHRRSCWWPAAACAQSVTVQVEVLPADAAGQAEFRGGPELLQRRGIGLGHASADTPEYRKLEQAYHRLAHLHRANLDVLGYSQMGPTEPDHAPVLDRRRRRHARLRLDRLGRALRPALWTAPPSPTCRAPACPCPPSTCRSSRTGPATCARATSTTTRRCPRPQEEYQQLITSTRSKPRPSRRASRRTTRTASRPWPGSSPSTSASAAGRARASWSYFNDKYYFKQPAQGGHGISWWLLDEPNHRDDVRARRVSSRWLLKRGLAKYPDAPIVFRTDISRVEWMRDLLPGQIDLDCTSSHLFDKNRFLMDDRDRFGRDFWNYASTNHPRDTNVAMRAWCWRVWLAGADGIVPWNTVRGIAGLGPRRAAHGLLHGQEVRQERALRLPAAESLPPRPAGHGVPGAAGQHARAGTAKR